MATLLMSWVSLLEQNLSTIFFKSLVNRQKKEDIIYWWEFFLNLILRKKWEEKEDEDYDSAS